LSENHCQRHLVLRAGAYPLIRYRLKNGGLEENFLRGCPAFNHPNLTNGFLELIGRKRRFIVEYLNELFQFIA
jgi:hypothetical protein